MWRVGVKNRSPCSPLCGKKPIEQAWTMGRSPECWGYCTSFAAGDGESRDSESPAPRAGGGGGCSWRGDAVNGIKVLISDPAAKAQRKRPRRGSLRQRRVSAGRQPERQARSGGSRRDICCPLLPPPAHGARQPQRRGPCPGPHRPPQGPERSGWTGAGRSSLPYNRRQDEREWV